MRKLDRKLLRDLAKMKGQSIAIALVIAAGIAVFVMSLCAYSTLKGGQLRFYRDYRFADVFTQARRAPNPLVDRVEEIDGVAAAEKRIVFNVLLDLPDLTEPATAKVISIPDSGQSRLNRVHITRGRMIEPDHFGEVVISETFAESHGYLPGDHIDAILNGRLQSLAIVGIALSPEFVIQIQDGAFLPDHKRYGIFWMSERELEAAFDMTGAFNSLSLKLTFGAEEEQVIDQLDRLLEPFGSLGAFTRSENISHQFVNDELKQLQTMATVAPAIFLSVAAFLLNIVVSRIITQQREQIAALKAFGYSNWEVGSHYLSLVLVIAIAGMVIGTLSGLWMAQNLTELYHRFYKFPLLTLDVDAFSILLALLLTTLVTCIGTWYAVGRAVKLPPAEAMRPEPPPTFRPTWLERILPTELLPAEVRMIFRNVQRKPFKSLASIVGIAMSVSVLVLGTFSLDSLDYLIDFQFRKAQRQDLTVNFVEPASSSVIYELAELDGVLRSETNRGVATRIRYQHRSKRVGILGLESTPELFRLLDVEERQVPIADHGIMLNTALATLLGVELGDRVHVEVLEDERPKIDLEVTALISEFGGTNAYMHKDQIHQSLGESPVATGAFLKVDKAELENIYQELQRRPGVAAVLNKEASLQSFLDTIAENMLTMRAFNILFAVIIAVGVVYNSARISLSEQSRDLATMRVMGFYTREVSTVLLGEISLFTLIALPLGCGFGYMLAWGMIQGLATENYRIPLVVSGSTFAFSCTVVIVATLFSGVVIGRRIAKLDMVSALKTRD